MDTNMDTNMNTNMNTSIENNIKLFYIDKKFDHKNFLIVKVNYEYFFTLSYDDIKTHLDLFYTFYINNKFTKKIIIILDIKLIKNILHTNNKNISNTNITSNIHLINLIKYINDKYNDYIIKCLLIHYTPIDKQIFLFCKQILKSIQFMNKVEIYSQDS